MKNGDATWEFLKPQYLAVSGIQGKVLPHLFRWVGKHHQVDEGNEGIQWGWNGHIIMDVPESFWHANFWGFHFNLKLCNSCSGGLNVQGGPPTVGKVDLSWRFSCSSMDLLQLFTNFHVGSPLCHYDLWFGRWLVNIEPACTTLAWAQFWLKSMALTIDFLIQPCLGHHKIPWFVNVPIDYRIGRRTTQSSPRVPSKMFIPREACRFSGDLLSQITISRQRMLDTVQNIADTWPSDTWITMGITIGLDGADKALVLSGRHIKEGE